MLSRHDTMIAIGTATRWHPLIFSRSTNTVFSLMTDTNDVTAVSDLDDMTLLSAATVTMLIVPHPPGSGCVRCTHAHNMSVNADSASRIVYTAAFFVCN